ncbi:MAG: hypothetical protein LBG59_09040 [Candidatus Peribacteria bacterium]|jgi:hypothetical protein|nr:hypothetical protein [Candidatus Peribacteria bacterium]
MVKEFQSIVQIKQYYRMKEKADMLAKRNYYLGRTKMVLGVSGLLKKYEKKLATFEKNNTIKLQRKMEKAIEDFSKGKKTETKTKKTENYTKGLALMQIQLYAKISRADKNGMVKEITTGKKVHRKETQGGHFISAQWNSTCFDLYNIRPQLKKSNFDMSQ